ncbi:PilN domain-containing protein [Luminiphilus sp.]|jgi:type IV pilus assembly protein PilN|nr:PilN domain-containing protein [Luminiphilus sp.]MDA8825882.1 PilN domain-containing protein [Luminiphilus sp.]MDA9580737.1 PilN domain-containing protein [Luminiphilus sp.]
MATINLLPWREELRAERKKEFIASLALMALVAIFILFVTDLMFDGRISFQEKRNAYVRQSIAELDEQVAEIRDLRGRRTELLERMRIIQDLQGNRPIIVRIMDQLVRTVPDGLFYTSLVSGDGKIEIEGVAESNNRVSSLMRRLESSDWLQSPNLEGVRAAPSYGDQATTFKLTVNVQLPEQEEEF